VECEPLGALLARGGDARRAAASIELADHAGGALAALAAPLLLVPVLGLGVSAGADHGALRSGRWGCGRGRSHGGLGRGRGPPPTPKREGVDRPRDLVDLGLERAMGRVQQSRALFW